MPDNNALHDAAAGGDLVQVQSQVGNFDINVKGEYEETALHKAAEKGYVDIVKLLLTFNPNVNATNVSTIKIERRLSEVYFYYPIILLLFHVSYTSRHLLLSLLPYHC